MGYFTNIASGEQDREDGVTLFIKEAQGGSTGLVETLVKVGKSKGINLDHRDNNNWSALHYAA